MQQQGLDFARQAVGILKVASADGAAADLVLVSGADAPARRADLGGAARFLAQDIELGMERQNERGILGQRQIVRRHRDAWPRTVSISFSSAQGSTTTPLPMTENFPETMPEGSKANL